jgi:ZIP family zinc transporter
MEARAATGRGLFAGAPVWLLGLIPLVLIGLTLGAFAVLGGPGLGQRSGVPIESLAVERTVLHPGEFELTVRNDGPDSVDIAQVSVNDGYIPFTASGGQSIGHLGSTTLTIPYDWIEGQAYEITLLTSTGGTISTEVASAAESPDAGIGFYGLMALLGLYVGLIPVAMGMLWLPFVRRVTVDWMRILIGFTVGLLAFLAIDATIEGVDLAGSAPSAFGGTLLVFLGALTAYLALSAAEGYLRGRQQRARESGPVAGAATAGAGAFLALLVAIGIGLHNLGEGLAVGSAYAGGALALGAFLVIGFAIHNTTEGLAIVAPLAETKPPRLGRLAGLGLIAGGPAILGAWIGAAAFNPSIGAFLLGVGAGAIVQVIRQLLPAMRETADDPLPPAVVVGILAGIAVMYATSLVVTV